MAKPTNLAEWGTSGSAVIAEPLLAEKQLGWGVAKKPPAQWMNWWMKTVYTWIVWLDAYESTAHTWTALQTFSAGLLAASFGAAPGTPGIRGTNAIAGTTGLSGSGLASAIKGTTSDTNSAGVFGESTAAGGRGGSFKNVAAHVGAIALEALGVGMGVLAVGGGFGGVQGILRDLGVAQNVNSGGVVGLSEIADYPGVRGKANELGAIGGIFEGLSALEDFEGQGTLALRARGGDSPSIFYDAGGGISEDYPAGDGLDVKAGDGRGDGTANTGYHGGSNVVRGGDIYSAENDGGQPGIGLQVFGGEVIGASPNGRRGGTALTMVGGDSGAAKGFAFEAFGDGVFNNAAKFGGANLAPSDPQVNQITAGLTVKAWALVSVNTSKAITIVAGQNVTAVGKTNTWNGSSVWGFYLDLATPIPRNKRTVKVQAQPMDWDAATYDGQPVYNGLGAATATRLIGYVVTRDLAGVGTVFNFDTPPTNIYLLVTVLGLQ